MKERANKRASYEEMAAPMDSQKGGKSKTSPKLPTMITHQVLVGLMNDLLSSCTFITLPQTNGKTVDVAREAPGRDRQHMLVLRFEKKGIMYEVLSHHFNPHVKGRDSQTSQEEARAAQLAVGIMAALRQNLKEPTVFSKVPLSILNGYLQKTLNRGGMWAYMSLPSFLGGKSADELIVRERRKKIMHEAAAGIGTITSTTIVALLWVIYYLRAEKVLFPICNALTTEFLQNHRDPQQLVITLYMGSLMETLSHEDIAKATLNNLNHVNILEKLTGEDLVILLAAFNDKDDLNLSAVRKVLLLLTDEAERLSPHCIACLLWILVKLKYGFGQNTHFTRKMMLRLSNVFDELPLSNKFLFSALAFVPCEMSYYDAILDSVILKLHLMDHKEIIMIGASYAFVGNLKNAESDLEAPRSEHIYHGLEFYVKQYLNEMMKDNETLLGLVYESVLANPECHFTEKIAESSVAFPRESLSQTAKRIHTRTPNLGLTKHQSGSSEAFKSVTTSTNAFKLFYLNLLEDCCIRYDQLDFGSMCLLIFALLTFHIDVSPLHQAMLVTQGLMLRKANNPVKIVEISPAEDIRQYEMSLELLQYTQSPTDPNVPLKIEGIEMKCYRLREIPVELMDGKQQTNAQTVPRSIKSPKMGAKEVNQDTPKKQPREAIPPLTLPIPGDTPPSDAKRKRQKNIVELLRKLTSEIDVDDPTNQPNIEGIIQKCQEALKSLTSGHGYNIKLRLPSSARSGKSTASRTKGRDKATNKSNLECNSTPITQNDSRTSGWKAQVGTRRNIDNVPCTNERYCIMYKIRTLRYHRAEIIKRRVAISYTYEKVKGVAR